MLQENGFDVKSTMQSFPLFTLPPTTQSGGRGSSCGGDIAKQKKCMWKPLGTCRMVRRRRRVNRPRFGRIDGKLATNEKKKKKKRKLYSGFEACKFKI